MDDELKRLIAEQRKDDKPYVVRERHVVAYLGQAEQYLANEGLIGGFEPGHTPECALHGRSTMRMKKRGDAWCVECDRIRKTALRRAAGVKPRATCRHGDDRKVRAYSDGAKRCERCRYEAVARANKRRKANGKSSR